MTNQVYKSAQGQSVDLGTIKLKNEHVRAVGNMNVNARGDVVDSNNQVIESKSRQIQRQNAQLTNVADAVVHTSSAAARRARQAAVASAQTMPVDTVSDIVPADTTPETTSVSMVPVEPLVEVPDPVEPLVTAPSPVEPTNIADAIAQSTPATSATGGGLAAAIARSKTIKQEKEKTFRQLQQDTPGVRKI